jgi:hypothetical protein
MYSQKNDSIYILGCEDNWDNIEKYKYVILIKIDSILSNDTILKTYKYEKITLCYTINESGSVSNTYFKENNGFGCKVDSVILNTLNGLKFEDAAVYNPCSHKRYSMNFTLPIYVVDKQSKEGINKKNVMRIIQ